MVREERQGGVDNERGRGGTKSLFLLDAIGREEVVEHTNIFTVLNTYTKQLMSY